MEGSVLCGRFTTLLSRLTRTQLEELHCCGIRYRNAHTHFMICSSLFSNDAHIARGPQSILLGSRDSSAALTRRDGC